MHVATPCLKMPDDAVLEYFNHREYMLNLVDAVPVFSEEEKLPAGGVGDLNHQSPVVGE